LNRLKGDLGGQQIRGSFLSGLICGALGVTLIEEVEYLTKFFSDLSQRWTLIIDECGNRRSAVGLRSRAD